RLPFWDVLNEEERARGMRFIRPRDRRRFVICRGSVRMILAGYLGISSREIEFRTGPGGKPGLVVAGGSSEASAWRFNVSHSDDMALLAVGRGRELGVDLERLRSIREAERIVESYFTAAELAQFAGLDPSDRTAAFLRGWTRKEAILKAKGVG